MGGPREAERPVSSTLPTGHTRTHLYHLRGWPPQVEPQGSGPGDQGGPGSYSERLRELSVRSHPLNISAWTSQEPPEPPAPGWQECGDWPGLPSRAGFQERRGVEATSLLRAGLRSRKSLSQAWGRHGIKDRRDGLPLPGQEWQAGAGERGWGAATLGDRPCTRDLGAAGLWLPVRG